MRFKVFLENQFNVQVDMSPYINVQTQYVQKTEAYYRTEEDRLKSFKFDPNKVQVPNYPHMDKLQGSFNQPHMGKEINRYHAWAMDKKNINISTQWDAYKQAREVYKHLRDYQDSKNPKTEEMVRYLHEKLKSNIAETAAFMEKIKAHIIQLISNANWNGTPVVIVPEAGWSVYNSQETSFEPTESATIKVNKASFGYSVIDGKPEVDEILEGGEEEEDFFTSIKDKADYYTLAKELENPGSSSKGKILTLYTARPKQDRQQYENAKTLPINVFLSNSPDHVEGLARDYGGRDIWKVRIDSKYLTQTNNGPIKYYMVSSENAPVVSISFIAES